MRFFSSLMMILIFVSLSLFSAHAEVGSGIGSIPRSAAPVCVNEPDSSIGLVERYNQGRTGQESVFGDELQCLERNGLAKNGALVESEYTASTDLNRFYDQCTFVQMPQEFRDLEKITEFVHLKNRDSLINGLWQDLANRSQRQLNCRIDTISQYQRDPSAKKRLDTKVEEKFNSILDKVRGLILSKRRIDSRNKQDVFSRIDCHGLAWFLCKDIVAEKNKIDLNKHEMAIAQEIAKIPFGYEPDVAAAFVTMADNGGFDPDLFAQALSKSENRYRQLEGYYSQRSPKSESGNGIFCIDREFKEKAASSGVAQKLIQSYPANVMDPTQKIILQCKINSKYKVAEANLDTAVNGAFMVAGVATAVMTAVPSGGGSLAAFGAVASAGLSAASFSYQVQKAHEACMRRDFLISPDGTEQCNPQEDFNKEMSEYKLSECLKESGWAALEGLLVPLDIAAVVKARRDLKIVDLVNDAAIADEIASIRTTGNPSAAALSVDGSVPIIVTGKKPKRYFRESEFKKLDNSLRSKGITYVEDIPQDVFRALSAEEKVFVIEKLNPGLSPDKGKKLKEFFEAHPDGNLSADEITELQRILEMGLDKASISEAAEMLRNLEEKGFVKKADQAAPKVKKSIETAPPASPARTEEIRSAVLQMDSETIQTRGLELSLRKDEMLEDLLGANASREDIEIAIDVISGNAHKDLYLTGTRGSAIPIERYNEIERMIKSKPKYAIYRDRMEELIEIRIRQGDKLADDEWAALKAEHPKVREGEPIDCSALSAIYPGSFPANGKCRRVEFDEEVSRRYCYCGGMGQVGFNWLTKCPGSSDEFRNLTSYIDDFALPHASSPEMCVRVSIPKGKQCYLGPTGATLSGFGGAQQLLCINRPFSSRTKDAAEAAKLQGAGGDLAVRPEVWSPFSTFTEFQTIVHDISVGCKMSCDPATMRSVRSKYDAAKSAIRGRLTKPSEIERFNDELERFDLYIQEIESGRRKYPYSVGEDGVKIPGPR